MMKALVIGCGLQGFEIARDLSKDTEVGVADIDLKKLEKCKRELKVSSSNKINVRNKEAMIKLMRKFDVVVGALPPQFGFELLKFAIEAGVDIVDISFMSENPFTLDALAKKKGVKIVPDCGLAPGLSNILIGQGVSKLGCHTYPRFLDTGYLHQGKVDEIHIKVGGLPKVPFPPLEYKTVFSLETVIEEYTRKAKIIKNSEIKEVEPLSGLEKIEFNGIGKFECFYTDGLRTLLYTMKGVKNMSEKTIRYPFHAKKIKTLIACGFFDTKPVKLDSVEIIPREFSLALLTPKLELGKEKDFTLLRVDIKGVAGGNCPQPTQNLRYELVDHYRSGVTSMARTTGYPCAIVARLLKDIKCTGVIPPEKLGMDNSIFHQISKHLKERKINIQELSNIGS